MITPPMSSRRFVGRKAELDALTDARRRLSSGRGQIVLVGGEAGLGKTRLVNELVDALEGSRGPLVAIGEALEHAPQPYGPIRMVFESFLASSPEGFATASPLAARTLRALVPERVAHDDAPMEKGEIFAGVLALLQTLAAKRTTFVALEDVHWADSATLELLAYLAPRISSMRIMIVATFRNDALKSDSLLSRALARIARDRTAFAIDLEPLGEREVRTLVSELTAGTDPLAPSSLRAIVRRADGNPLYVEELTKAAVARGGHLPDDSLPLPIRGLILEPLADLAPFDRRVLDHAAVFGPYIDVALLAAIVGAVPDEILPVLRRLREGGIVFEDPATPGRFRFRHALTRAAIYGELLAVETRALHARIATMLEADPATADVAALAFHYWEAGDPRAALAHNESAGDSALALRAADEAASYFSRALSATDDGDARARILPKLGEALIRRSEFVAAAAAFDELWRLHLARGERDAAATAFSLAAGEVSNGGDLPRALEMLKSFLAEHGAGLAEGSRDHLNACLGRLMTNVDCDEARAILLRVENPDALAPRTYILYWAARMFVAERDVDRDAFDESVAALRRRLPEINPFFQTQILHSIGMAALSFGANAVAEVALDEAIAIDLAYDFPGALSFARGVRSRLYELCGRLEDARHDIRGSLSDTEVPMARFHTAVSGPLVGAALLDFELVGATLDDAAFATFSGSGPTSARLNMLASRAVAAIADRRPEDASALLTAAIDVADFPHCAVHFWPLAARLVDLPRLTKTIELLRSRPNREAPVMAAVEALVGAIVAQRRGEVLEARAGARDAADRYAKLGWPLFEARAREIAGDAEGALAIYRATGSVADVRRFMLATADETPRTGAAAALSPREGQVARLVARGKTNRAIAREMDVAEKTVEKYVTSIYAKLGFSSRAELAAHVARAEDPSAERAEGSTAVR